MTHDTSNQRDADLATFARREEVTCREGALDRRIAHIEALLGTALERDQRAEQRDRRAEQRDLAAEARTPGCPEESAAASADRAQSALDRYQAGVDRDLSAGDRVELHRS